MPLRVVLDTNVLVSGLIGRAGPPRQLLDAWLEGSYILVSSLYQVQELNHVLSYPRISGHLTLTGPELDAILAAVLSEAEIVEGELDLAGATRDPKDDPLLAAALLGKVDYLVSGDRDLLDLEAYEGIKMITPREFVSALGLDVR